MTARHLGSRHGLWVLAMVVTTLLVGSCRPGEDSEQPGFEATGPTSGGTLVVVAGADLAGAITGAGFFAVTSPGSATAHYDGLTITGNAIIPEPSTFALTALGLLSLGFVGWRRRRR